MPFVVRSTLPNFAGLEWMDRGMWLQTGREAVEMIVARTRRGQDASGQAFTDYSEGYRQLKQEYAGTSDVNLTVSGDMLNALTVIDQTKDSVTLGWTR